MHRIIRFVLCLAAAAGLASAASAQTKLLRFPDIYKDKVVFTYAGDLWTAPVDGGGTATRITAIPGFDIPPGSRRTASASPSLASTTATSRSTSSRPPAGFPGSPSSSPPRTVPSAVGIRQPGLWLDAGRQVGRLPLAARRLASQRQPTRCAVAGGLWRAAPDASERRRQSSPDGRQVVYTPFAVISTGSATRGRAQDLWIFDLATRATKRSPTPPCTEAPSDVGWLNNTTSLTAPAPSTLLHYPANGVRGGG